MKRLLATLLTAGLVLGLAACGGGKKTEPTSPPANDGSANTQQPSTTPNQADGPARPNKLDIGIGAMPRTLDPFFDSSSTANAAYSLLFETLVSVDEDGSPQPMLAKSWEVVDDTIWEFKLLEGVKFHNGEPFDAESVKFSIEFTLNPDNKAPWAARIRDVQEVKVIDPYTVRFITAKPFPALIKGLSQIWMVPAKYYQEKGSSQAFSDAPVGTGPYKFVEWKQDDHVTLAAWDGHRGGKPPVEKITFHHRPEASPRVAGLSAGEFDVVFDVPPDQATHVKGQGMQIVSALLGQNITINVRSFIEGPLQDKRVRQALNYAVDKEAISQELYAGFARVLDGQIVGPGAFGYNPQLKPYEYNPEKAKQLLVEAGYPNGFPIRLEVTQGRYPKDKEVGELVQAYLLAVGIQAEIEVLESSVFLQKLYDGTLGPLGMSGWMWMPAMDAELPMSYFLSGSALTFLKDQNYDNTFAAATASMDQQRREQKLQEAAALFRDEAPQIFLVQLPLVVGVQPWVKGFEPRSNYTFDPMKVQVSQ